jgi:ribonuclease G
MPNIRKEIMISVSSTETRIAILEDGNLVELFFENLENARMVGDIYKGRVENVVEAVHAAFIEIGLEQNGFLSFSDLGEKVIEYSALAETVETREEGKRPSHHRRFKRHERSMGNRNRFYLKPGQEILVQIAKEPIGGKGARLTAALSLPGRFCVLVPNDTTVGVSKKIESDHERHRLRRIAKQLCPQGFGLIIRTVASGKDYETLKADFDTLLRTWRKIEEKAKTDKAPKLIHKDMGITSSVIRDLFSSDVSRVVVDSKKLYLEIKEYLAEVAPGLLPKVELYHEHIPLFDQSKIEDQIERSLSRKIWLRRGGTILFDQVEAMTVIDVNSGRSIGHRDHELTAYETDLEAAREIGRQLRLRDIGGIVTIDFIDLKSDKHRKRIVNELHRELKKDQAVFDILPMNDFGLVSLTRERVRPSLFLRYSEPCPRCEGLGRIPAKSMVLTKIEKRIHRMKSETGERRYVLKVHPNLAEYLSKGFNSPIRQYMMKFLVIIKLVNDESLKEEDFNLITTKEEKKRKKGFLSLTS